MLGDCLERMKEIPDGSVDMILCDLPYGTMKGAKLDGWVNQTTKRTGFSYKNGENK